MVTRLYLGNDTPGYTPSTVRGTWNSSTGAVDQHLGRRRRGGGSAVTSIDSSTTNPNERRLGRWVSDPLAAQTISGTVDFLVLMRETDAAANMTLKAHIYVTQGDTDTPRGTLLSNFVDTTEFVVSGTTYDAVSIAGVALSSLAVSAGDRIVIELGYSAANAVSTSYTGGLKYGGLSSDATAGTTGQSGTGSASPWVEFSGDIAFAGLTYLYPTYDAAPVTPGATRGTWDATGAVQDKLLGSAPSGTKTNNAQSETVATNPYDMLAFRFVSPELAAQTLSAVNWMIVWTNGESAADADSFPKVHIYVMKPDGTVRGTLLADQVSGTESPTSGQMRNDSYTVSSVVCSAGDRIVVEQGARHTNVLTASKATNVYAGGSPAELESSGGLNSSADGSAWIRVPQDIAWLTARPRSSVVAMIG